MKKTTLLSGTVSLPQNLLKKILLTCFAMATLFSGPVLAQTTFTGATNNNWNLAGNWSAGIPTGAIAVIIPTGKICNMASGNSYTGSGAITLAGTLSVPTGATFKPTGVVTMNTNGASLSGGGTVNLITLTIATTNTTDIVSITNSSGAFPITMGIGNTTGILNLNKGILKLGSTNTLAFAKTGTINATKPSNFANKSDTTHSDADSDGGTVSLVGTSGGTVTVDSSVTLYNVNFYNASIAGSDGNVKLDLKTTTTIINGTCTKMKQSTVIGSTNSPIWGSLSTLYINNGGTDYAPGKEWVVQAGTPIIGTTPGYPNNVLITNIGTSAGNNFGWKPTGNWRINGSFTVGDGTGTSGQVDFTNVTNFSCTGFTLNASSRFSPPSTTMTVAGNWTDNQVPGTFLGFSNNTYNGGTGTPAVNSGTVIFTGKGICDSANTIQAVGTGEKFFNLGADNGTYTKLNSPVTVTDTLTLTKGILATSNPTNILSITNTDTAAISPIPAGNDSTYIDGPVKWSLQAVPATYVFPVGNTGVGCAKNYLPFTLRSSNTTAGNVATVQAFAAPSGGVVDATMSSLFPSAYWSLATTASLVTGSKVSVASPATAIAPYILIAKSNGPAAAGSTYTSLAGTVGTFGVSSSNNIGVGSTFFITLGALPIVSTLAPTSITTTSVTLQGSYNTQGAPLTTSFNWGTTTAYGLTVNSIHSPMNNTSATQDSATITGLIPNTGYHYRATDGSVNGGDTLFYTAPLAPTIGSPSNATGNGFTASWSAPTGMGSAPYTYTLEVSTDPTFSTIVATQTGIPSGTTSVALNTLSISTTYYYRVQAANTTAASAWSATSTGITTLAVITPVCNAGQSIQTGAPPVIDGTVDPGWSSVVTNTISNAVVTGAHCSGGCLEAGFSAQWQSQWDANNLYLLVRVTDPVWYSAPSNPATSQYFNYDAVEVYISGTRNNGGSYGANDAQYGFSVPTAGGASSSSLVFTGPSNGSSTSTSNIIYAEVASTGGYTVEIKIPWTTLGIAAPTMDQQIGLGVGIDENHSTPSPPNSSNGDYRDAQYQWNTTNNDLFTNPSHIPSVPLTAPPSLPNAGTDQSVCSSANATLNAAAPTIGVGTWSVLSGPSTATSQFSSVSNPVATFTPANAPANTNGTYTLLWTVTNSPCTATTYPPDTVIITTTPIPTAAISGNTAVCENGSATITFSGTTNAVVTYTINSGSNQTVLLDATGNATVSTGPLTAAATYALVSVAASASSSCSQNVSGTASVTMKALPVVTITSSADTTDGTIPVTLTGTSTINGTPLWSVSPIAPIDNPAAMITSSTPTAVNTYIYTLTVDSANCTGSAQHTIVVINSGCTLHIPNAFTPNGDGYNDTWIITSGCYVITSVDVYNRWGSLVYHSDNYSSANPWDGTYHGEKVPDATYYYVVKATSPTANPIKKGSLTIIR